MNTIFHDVDLMAKDQLEHMDLTDLMKHYWHLQTELEMYTDFIKRLKEDVEATADEIASRTLTEDITSTHHRLGTITATTQTHANVTDKKAMLDWVYITGNFDMLPSRVNKNPTLSQFEKHGDIPGITLFQKRRIAITKPKTVHTYQD